jgi:hypothetical protein
MARLGGKAVKARSIADPSDPLSEVMSAAWTKLAAHRPHLEACAIPSMFPVDAPGGGNGRLGACHGE